MPNHQQETFLLGRMARVGQGMNYEPELDIASSTNAGTSYPQNNVRTSNSSQASPNSSGVSNRKVPAYLSRDFHPCDWPKEDDCFGQLGTMVDVNQQEQLLLCDLLYILIGIEGKYIRLRKSEDSSRYKLILDPSTDRHLVVTTNQILKISYCYSAIITYVESKVYGLVNQALVAAMQRHLLEYNMLVAQMEEIMLKNELFLQKMFYMLLPYMNTFSLLRDLATKLYKVIVSTFFYIFFLILYFVYLQNKCMGGGVLSVLHEKTKSIQGMDNKALDLCLTLTKCASIPYFDILKTWIYYGEISDPRREFFIEDTQHSSSTCLSSSPGKGEGTSVENGPTNSSGKANSRCKINSNYVDNIIESDDEYDDDFGKFNE